MLLELDSEELSLKHLLAINPVASPVQQALTQAL